MTQGPIWEKPLRAKLATLCMAALSKEPGVLAAATDDIVSFCHNLSGCDDGTVNCNEVLFKDERKAMRGGNGEDTKR